MHVPRVFGTLRLELAQNVYNYGSHMKEARRSYLAGANKDIGVSVGHAQHRHENTPKHFAEFGRLVLAWPWTLDSIISVVVYSKT